MVKTRSCFLCGYKYNPLNKRISLHSFPKTEDIKKKWMEVCGFNELDNLKYIYLCSKHFKPEDFNNLDPLIKPRLKDTAVPFKQILNICNLPSHEEVDLLTSLLSTSVSECSTNVQEIEQSDAKTTENITEVEDHQLPRPSTPKGRRFYEPRFISEIMTPDVKTPRRARRVIQMAKRESLRQKLKFRKVWRTNRQLNKKVETLERIISQLRKKDLISHAAKNKML